MVSPVPSTASLNKEYLGELGVLARGNEKLHRSTQQEESTLAKPQRSQGMDEDASWREEMRNKRNYGSTEEGK